ncbi:TPA: hypothetical protein ACQM8N_000779 [Streptococcus pyogenes]|uniref:hypothetical protein n=1 Tax=Streptococcus pyogenes TaxID=1314 RepID=UPI00109C03B5|nr:hypothetical protein [Streptococcus pyogenes]VGR94528.1 hypothetical membrane associated protein [Streptococcus pyogenes]
MKTKSKRFLNLATLCLALLGTTLLTTQPVKAEAIRTDGQTEHISQSTDGQSTDGQSTDGQSTDGQSTDGQSTDGQKDRDAGYKDGLRDGRRDAQTLSEPREPDQDQGDFKSLDYCDGYFIGYYRGWDEVRYPVQTFLKDIFDWVYDIFFS